ncbi:MAG: hypothetical protein IH934_01625 [Nanoarchaeota archaeon]|nr:hypothetical protein [Nanoarchaeota archaeon]
MVKEEEKKEDSVYDEEGREKLVEEGEMSPEEAGFMKGYEEADKEKGGEKEKMKLTKEEWNEEFKKRYNEARKLHPDWDSDKVKMIVSRDMPKITDDDGWE